MAGEMTQSSSHESQSAETHNERRHVTHTHILCQTGSYCTLHCIVIVYNIIQENIEKYIFNMPPCIR